MNKLIIRFRDDSRKVILADEEEYNKFTIAMTREGFHTIHGSFVDEPDEKLSITFHHSDVMFVERVNWELKK